MSDVARKVFPLESVLALLAGKEDAAVAELAGFLAGRSLCCSSALVAPMAAGWLASLYPAFINLDYDESRPWADFVSGMKAQVGDHVSVPPMTGRFQAMVAKLLDVMAERSERLKEQAAEIAALQARVEALTPFQGKAEEQEKKNGQLEARIKSLNADISALRREMAPFQGKMPVDQQQLENIIQDAIAKNLKNFVAAAGEAAPEAAVAESPAGAPDEFGFGSSADRDGFGF